MRFKRSLKLSINRKANFFPSYMKYTQPESPNKLRANPMHRPKPTMKFQTKTTLLQTQRSIIIN